MRTQHAGKALVIVGVASAFVACNSSSDGQAGTSGTSGPFTGGTLRQGPPVPVQEYGTALARLFCPQITPCCAERLGSTVSNTDCVTAMAEVFSSSLEGADPANYSYDADLAGDCVATVEPLYQRLECGFSDAGVDVDPAIEEACSRIFTGKLEPGQPCNSSVECAAGPGDSVSCDELELGSELTVCTVDKRALLGDDCRWTCTESPEAGTTCWGSSIATQERTAVSGECYTNDGLYCSSDGSCAQQAALGEACGDDAGCTEGYCGEGVCQAPGASGADCVTDTWCREPYYCSPIGSCEPRLADGASCGSSNECSNGRCVSGTCGSEADSDELGLALLCGIIGESGL